MSETEDFQRLAHECLARADDPEITQPQRQLLIEMATAWKELGHNDSVAGPEPAPLTS